MGCSKQGKLMFGREMEDDFEKDLSFKFRGKEDTHIPGAQRHRHEKSEDNTPISDLLVMDKGEKGREGDGIAAQGPFWN